MPKGRKPVKQREDSNRHEPVETHDESYERERREAMERHKQEQIEQRRKDSDGVPIV